MYETTVFFGGTLSGALQGFCSSVMTLGRDPIHAEQLSQGIKEQYRGRFLISMRVYYMMDFLLNMAAKSVVARDFKQVTLIPLRGEYLLQWIEEDFRVTLTVPRSPGKPFGLFVMANDPGKIRKCTDRFGIKECKVEISPDTLLTLEEFVELNWNAEVKAVRVPYSELLAILKKHQKK